MNLNPGEISNIIKAEIKHFETRTDEAEVSTVILVGDGIARAHGLDNCMANELLEFDGGDFGMAQNLEEDSVSIALLSNKSDIKEGTVVRRTGRV
ncbi:MAG: F0F1 ATP synthase subunit alpha, partial [Firmicutes bacterium]|nr:F0F1 ATP synthase subunit alpha [Candidatus Colimorpha enterica]